MGRLITRHDLVKNYQHGLYLGSLVCLLIGSVFFPKDVQPLVILVLSLVNVLCALLLAKGKSIWIRAFFFFFLIYTVVRTIGQLLGYDAILSVLGEVVFISYFLIVALVLFHDLYIEKDFGMDSAYAVFSGFILLALAFGFVFMWIDRIEPGAIKGIQHPSLSSEYHYFSFITLLTIGYGDITPSTDMARKAVIFAALVGHFYTVFVTAIIIGKLTSNPNEAQS